MSVGTTGGATQANTLEATVDESCNLFIAFFSQTRNPPNLPTSPSSYTLGGSTATGLIGHATSGSSRIVGVYWLSNDLPSHGIRTLLAAGASSATDINYLNENNAIQQAPIIGEVVTGSTVTTTKEHEFTGDNGDSLRLFAHHTTSTGTYSSPDAVVFGVNENSRLANAYRVDGETITIVHSISNSTLLGLVAMFGIGSAVAPVITDPSPTGTLLTPRTATIEVATDTAGGTMYLVVDEASLTGIDDEDIEGGFLPDGTTEAFIAESKAVTDGLVQFGIEGLDPDTAYNYALVQKVGSLYSNVEVGSFTTSEVTTGVMLVGEDRITLPGSDDLLSEEGLHVTVWDGRPGDSESTIIVDTTADIIDGELILEVSAVTLEDPIHVLVENADLSIFARYSGTIVEVPTVGET